MHLHIAAPFACLTISTLPGKTATAENEIAVQGSPGTRCCARSTTPTRSPPPAGWIRRLLRLVRGRMLTFMDKGLVALAACVPAPLGLAACGVEPGSGACTETAIAADPVTARTGGDGTARYRRQDGVDGLGFSDERPTGYTVEFNPLTGIDGVQ